MIGIGLEEQPRNFIAGKAFHREGRKENPRRSQRESLLSALCEFFFAYFAVKGFWIQSRSFRKDRVTAKRAEGAKTIGRAA
jgi:hypothetical protein